MCEEVLQGENEDTVNDYPRKLQFFAQLRRLPFVSSIYLLRSSFSFTHSSDTAFVNLTRSVKIHQARKQPRGNSFAVCNFGLPSLMIAILQECLRKRCETVIITTTMSFGLVLLVDRVGLRHNNDDNERERERDAHLGSFTHDHQSCYHNQV